SLHGQMISFHNRTAGNDVALNPLANEIAPDYASGRLAADLDRGKHLSGARPIHHRAVCDKGIAAVRDPDATETGLEHGTAKNGRLPAVDDLDGPSRLLRPRRRSLYHDAVHDAAVTVFQADAIRGGAFVVGVVIERMRPDDNVAAALNQDV